MDDFFECNRALWNDKTEVHLNSAFYNVNAFKQGRSSLNQAELEALGDVTGKSLLHLQCHFGLDTLSWARLGAQVTGVDLSDKAIAAARQLAAELNLKARFIESNIYDLKKVLDEKFDIVFTSYGTISWLDDLGRWAEIISSSLKPGGLFYIIEFHPAIWMFNDDFTQISYSYFNLEPVIEDVKGSYADRNAPILGRSVSWNHSLAEVFTALKASGLKIDEFMEYPFSYYNCFSNTVKGEDGYFRIKNMENKLPMMFAIKAIK